MVHILGKKSPQEEILIRTRMWAREPGTRPILQFIYDYRDHLRKDESSFAADDVALNWTAGFVCGMSLLGGVFLGEFSVSTAKAVINIMDEEIKSTSIKRGEMEDEDTECEAGACDK